MRFLAAAQFATAAVLIRASGPTAPDDIFEAVLSTYPGYSGSLSTLGGKVVISTAGSGATASQVLGWKFTGPDIQDCATSVPATANACGIHIHSGKSCADAAKVGGHFWEGAEGSDDPWKTVAHSTKSGITSAVVTAASAADVNGRVVVVHDETGSRISCGVIKKLTSSDISCLTATIRPYPGYTGILQVAGSVKVTSGTNEGKTAQVVQYDLSGTDPACVQSISGVGNACGIHVHSGKTCSDGSEVGGHYWLTTASVDDPWGEVVYGSAGDGVASGATGGVATGAGSGDILGRAFVVHDATGARIGCGLLAKPSVGKSDAGKSDATSNSASPALGRSAALAPVGALMILAAWVM